MTEHDPHEEMAYDEAFANRVAAPLREAEQLSGDFGARVMDAVRVEARVRHSVATRTPTPPRALEPPDVPLEPPAPAWWRRDRTLRVTPLGALAMAAGLLIAAALGAYGALRLGLPLAVAPIAAPADSSRAVVAAADTVHVVRFVFVDSSAQTVALVGDFNAWARESTPLLRDAASGVWTATVALPSGRHEYAFIVNGERWVADPFAARVRDEYEADYSVVTVGDRRS